MLLFSAPESWSASSAEVTFDLNPTALKTFQEIFCKSSANPKTNERKPAAVHCSELRAKAFDQMIQSLKDPETRQVLNRIFDITALKLAYKIRGQGLGTTEAFVSKVAKDEGETLFRTKEWKKFQDSAKELGLDFDVDQIQKKLDTLKGKAQAGTVNYHKALSRLTDDETMTLLSAFAADSNPEDPVPFSAGDVAIVSYFSKLRKLASDTHGPTSSAANVLNVNHRVTFHSGYMSGEFQKPADIKKKWDQESAILQKYVLEKIKDFVSASEFKECFEDCNNQKKDFLDELMKAIQKSKTSGAN